MRNATSCEHVIQPMTIYELLQKHLMTKEVGCGWIGHSKCAKEGK